MAMGISLGRWIAAKTDRSDPTVWLPLSWHLLDTAGVMEVLARTWLPAAVYKEIGIKRADCKKIARFLALTHDIGKATPVFQRKILEKLPEIRAELEALGFPMPAPMGNEVKHAHAGSVLLRCAGVPSSIAAVIGAHHGKPESGIAYGWDEETDLQEAEEEREEEARQYGNKNSPWQEVQLGLIEEAIERAGYHSADEIPEISEKAQMILSGLLIMADWISSNTAYFPLLPVDEALPKYDEERADRAMQRLALPSPFYVNDYWKQEDFFPERFGFTPNDVQQKICRAAEEMESSGLMILEAPMGEGKTEAALAAGEILMEKFNLGGLAFFLPSQATSNAMFSRILGWLENQPDKERISIGLLHSNAELNPEFARLAEGDVALSDDEEQLTVHSFFRGRKTKLLSSVVIGTVDQLLMAALRQKHVMLRHLGIAGKVVIIDECHAYDAYMNVYFDRILNWLGSYGIPVILLSATLPGDRREELMTAYAGKKKCRGIAIREESAYPLLSIAGDTAKLEPIPYKKAGHTVSVERADEEEAVREIGETLQAGGCIGVILNTVRRVQNFAEVIAKRFPDARIYIDHSQFLLPDRLEHEEEILQHVGKISNGEDRKRVVVIGSQVLEQSLDLDFDRMITDLCPMDLLLQRIGRLHRHERIRPNVVARAKCIVLHGEENTLESGAKAVYGEYILQQTASLLPDQIKIPGDISMLVQKTYCEDLGKEKFPQAYATYCLERRKSKDKAKGFLMRRSGERLIAGLLDDTVEFDDPQAQAAVRDGCDSVEILMLRLCGAQEAEILSGEKKGLRIAMNRGLSAEEALAVAGQRLRLPARFSRIWNIERTIGELERKTRECAPEWIMHPMLSGELLFFLDEEGKGRLGNCLLRYDGETGLTYEEVQDEGYRI